jgi:hypothetical protein
MSSRGSDEARVKWRGELELAWDGGADNLVQRGALEVKNRQLVLNSRIFVGASAPTGFKVALSLSRGASTSTFIFNGGEVTRKVTEPVII